MVFHGNLCYWMNLGGKHQLKLVGSSKVQCFVFSPKMTVLCGNLNSWFSGTTFTSLYGVLKRLEALGLKNQLELFTPI
ncbi:hypothetical protein DsansV1_C26g0193781 [Dioscorea sansibarensis]